MNFSAPNLTHLTILDADKYDLENFLDVTHLPKLTNLSVRHYRISQLFQTSQRCHEEVKSLELDISTYCYQKDALVASAIAHLFPSVTEFKVKLKVETYTELFTTDLAEAVGSFRAWELAKGEIIVNGVSPDVVAAVLEGVTRWRGKD